MNTRPDGGTRVTLHGRLGTAQNNPHGDRLAEYLTIVEFDDSPGRGNWISVPTAALAPAESDDRIVKLHVVLHVGDNSQSAEQLRALVEKSIPVGWPTVDLA